MFRLRRFLKKYILQFVIGPICKLIEAIFELFIPLITADIIDTGVKNHDAGYVMTHGGLMLLLGVLGLCFALVCQKVASIASQGFGTQVRKALFRHINSLSHTELDKLGTPSLITRLTYDVNQLQLSVAMSIRLVTRAPFLVVGALIMAMSINMELSVIFLVASPLIAMVLFLIMNRSVPFFKKQQKTLDTVSLISGENLSGNRVIRAFGREKSEQERFNAANSSLADTALTAGRISALLNPLTYVIVQAAIIAIIWFGSNMVYDGELTPGQIIALVNYMTQILLAMIVVSNLVVIFTRTAASAARVNEVFDTKPSVVETNTEPLVPDEAAPAVEFDHVSFSYPDSGDALKDISFTLKRGETLGIIGGTGSGKSTLINLIPRFYDPTEGSVRVFGANAADYPFSQLRKLVGTVPQTASLFSGTIRDNICLGNRGADDETVARALRISQSAEFVEKLPDKVETAVSAGGKNFSGGQRQRLTIARAIAANPSVLILDDSASALDYATDAKLRRALKEETQGTTLIIVSQRIASVRYADKILVLEHGEAVGFGTHEELLESCPVYSEICMSQGVSAQEVRA